jgi:hypothetical protein
VPSLEEVGAKADVIFSSLANDQVAKDTWVKIRAGAAAAAAAASESGASKRKLFVETSTLYPAVVGTFFAAPSLCLCDGD